MREVELIIIGAGPAGISAATEAAKYGAQVVLLDEHPEPGGQIYCQIDIPLGARNGNLRARDYVLGKTLIDEFVKYKDEIKYFRNALVWGIFNEREVAFLHNGKSRMLKARKLVLAEGAYDRPLPFPGWTLPGVLTAGGAQRILKTEGVLPGKRILLAGTGPLQFALATQLIRAGAEVVGILEAATFWDYHKLFTHVWGQWPLFMEGLGHLWELKRAKIPFLTSCAITEVRGEEEVTQAIYANINADWSPKPGTEKKVDVDTVCVGYGLVPSTRLSRLCGCEHTYNPYLGGWIPSYDDNMESTLPGIFVAGDGSGVAGTLVAIEEGRLAAIKVCQQLDCISEASAYNYSLPILTRLKGLRRFESAIGEISAIRRGLFDRITNDTIVCRCEEITAGEIWLAINNGARNINEIKRFTRAGMGNCQGRMCEDAIAQLISLSTNQTTENVGYLTPRPPVKPLPLGSFSSTKVSANIDGFIHP